MTNPTSLRQRLLRCLLVGGEWDTVRLNGIIGMHILPAQALRAARRDIAHDTRRKKTSHHYPLTQLISRGQRLLIREALKDLCREGKIECVRKGVYRTPLLKLFPPVEDVG